MVNAWFRLNLTICSVMLVAHCRQPKTGKTSKNALIGNVSRTGGNTHEATDNIDIRQKTQNNIRIDRTES
jgi:hypothetical protein